MSRRARRIQAAASLAMAAEAKAFEADVHGRLEGLAAFVSVPKTSNILVVGPEDTSFKDAVDRAFGIRGTTVMALFADATPAFLESAVGHSRAGFDVIVVAAFLDRLAIGNVGRALREFGSMLAKNGRLVLVVDTFAAPSVLPGVGRHDAILFPALGRQGRLGAAVARRTPLTAAGWLLMFRNSGFQVDVVDGYDAQPLQDDVLCDHFHRLGVFDSKELNSGRLRLIGRVAKGTT